MSYTSRLISSARFINTTRPIKISSYNHRNLSTSSSNHGILDNLKKNMAESQAQNEKLKKAQQQMNQQADERAKKFGKFQDKMSKVSEDSLSGAGKMAGDFKKKIESISENESYQKLQEHKENIKQKATQKGIKFKMPELDLPDTEIQKEIREAADAAAVMGTSLTGILDTSESYKRPDPPRKRKPDWLDGGYVFDADEDTTTATIHKSAFFEKRMHAFKESRVGQKFSNFSATMEDSDSSLVRGAYMFGWKIKESLKMNAEVNEVITEIQRVDPKFDLNKYAELLQYDIMPNILEIACLGDEEMLDDWCSEGALAVLLSNKKMAAKEGLNYLRHIYSLQNIEFMDASIDDDTDMPTLMFTAETQEIVALTNKKGEVLDGSLEKPMKNMSVWVFGRDMDEPDPKAAWRLLEIQSSATKMSF